MRRRLYAILSTLSVAACGGATDPALPGADAGAVNDATARDSGQSAQDGGALDAGNDAGSVTLPDASLPLACPATAPTQGAGCAKQGLVCEYGGDIAVNCDTLARCTTQGRWEVTPPTGATCPTPAPGTPAGCPSTFAGVTQGGSCSPAQLLCGYPEGLCICASRHGLPGTWLCAPTAAGCSYPRPRFGASCASPGLVCDYGACSSLPSAAKMTCTDGVWQETRVLCPP